MTDPRTLLSMPCRSARLAATALALGLLAACGGVQIRPEPVLPEAVIEPLPADVGLLVPEDMRTYVHKETRWGVNWEADLGPGHLRLARELFDTAFNRVIEFTEKPGPTETGGLKAVFEPRIEQFSFVTARETGGRYYAVTIRYRINLYTPLGELADSYTLTGYGTALARGLSSGRPLQAAALAAMRDAAAKFLVQFPEQPAGERLAKNLPVVVAPVADASADGPMEIEAVPINEPGAEILPPKPPVTTAPPQAPQPPAGTAPAEPVAAGTRPAAGLR